MHFIEFVKENDEPATHVFVVFDFVAKHTCVCICVYYCGSIPLLPAWRITNRTRAVEHSFVQ